MIKFPRWSGEHGNRFGRLTIFGWRFLYWQRDGRGFLCELMLGPFELWINNGRLIHWVFR